MEWTKEKITPFADDDKEAFQYAVTVDGEEFNVFIYGPRNIEDWPCWYVLTLFRVDSLGASWRHVSHVSTEMVKHDEEVFLNAAIERCKESFSRHCKNEL